MAHTSLLAARSFVFRLLIRLNNLENTSRPQTTGEDRDEPISSSISRRGFGFSLMSYGVQTPALLVKELGPHTEPHLLSGLAKRTLRKPCDGSFVSFRIQLNACLPGGKVLQSAVVS